MIFMMPNAPTTSETQAIEARSRVMILDLPVAISAMSCCCER